MSVHANLRSASDDGMGCGAVTASTGEKLLDYCQKLHPRSDGSHNATVRSMLAGERPVQAPPQTSTT